MSKGNGAFYGGPRCRDFNKTFLYLCLVNFKLISTWDSKGSQKSRLVFDLGIMLIVVQEKVGIDEGNENKYWVWTVFSCNSFWCGCHAKRLTEITVCLKHNWCLLSSKVDIGIFVQYFCISQFLA